MRPGRVSGKTASLQQGTCGRHQLSPDNHGGHQWFVHAILLTTSRTFPFAVKLGSILRSPHLLQVGLSQGSALSFIFFNVGMNVMVPISSRDGIMISTTMYIDDLCTWAASNQMRPLVKVFHDTPERTSSRTTAYVSLRKIASSWFRGRPETPPKDHAHGLAPTS